VVAAVRLVLLHNHPSTQHLIFFLWSEVFGLQPIDNVWLGFLITKFFQHTDLTYQFDVKCVDKLVGMTLLEPQGNDHVLLLVFFLTKETDRLLSSIQV
jgi:hypothetical protein